MRFILRLLVRFEVDFAFECFECDGMGHAWDKERSVVWVFTSFGKTVSTL